MAPLLSKHKLCVLPRVLERIAVDRSGARDEILVSVALKVAFDLISALDQSRHTVEAYGEALDGGDKATSKAMSAAYKSAMLQTFCIPVAGNEDADANTHKLRKWVHEPEPIQGWEPWSKDIIEIISSCETEEALGRVQNSNRSLLKALSRERSDLYACVGEAFASQRSSFSSLATAGSARRRPDKVNGEAARKASFSPKAETALA
jgi:hypothetical protein